MEQRIVMTVFCAALVLCATRIGSAQVEQGRSFEVASVRLTESSAQPIRRVTDTRVDWTNISLQNLLLRAFKIDPPLDPRQLVAPDWVADVNIDLHAIIPEGSIREHVPEMLKTLLTERFGLRAHTERHPRDVYKLTVGDRIRMQEVEAVNELEKLSEAAREGATTVDSPDGRVRSELFADGRLVITTERSRYERFYTDRGTYEIDAARITMTQLAGHLSFAVERPVIDGTGLTGVYRLRIELPLGRALIPRRGASPTSTATTINEPPGVSVFRSVEELGLKLEPDRIPLDTIVVDEIKRAPTDN